jgi:SAM-dependent methyltransferase
MTSSAAFSGSIPQAYHTFLGPLIFQAYSADMARRLAPRAGEHILELACGTGIVTRAIVDALPSGSARLTATDLNQPMLDVASTHIGADPRVTFQVTDACKVPFADRAFDAIACQFGVMFFPDKEQAMREARRVLKPGGRYVFNVWDSLAHNPIPRVAHETVQGMLPQNPPTFLARLPYAYHDLGELERVTRAAGFTSFAAERVELPCSAPSAEDAARAFVEGTPVQAELAERGVNDPAPFRAAVAKALAERFGDRPCRSTMRAIVVVAS